MVPFFQAGCRCGEKQHSIADVSVSTQSPADHAEPIRESSVTETDPERIVIAESLGITITLQDVLDVWERNPGVEEPSELIRKTLGYKLAYSEAKSRSINENPNESWVDYVERFLTLAFHPDSTCRNIEQLELVRHLESRRRRYQHPDIFHVVDAQYICCPKDKAPCVGDPNTETCFAEALPTMERAFVRAKLQTRDRASFEASVKPPSGQSEPIKITAYRFAYDFDQPHYSQQGNWVVMDPAIVKAVQQAQTRDVLPPVRTEYGIHLLYLLERKSKSTGDLSDPTVAERVRDDLCAEMVLRAHNRYVQDLVQGYPLNLQTEAVELLQNRIQGKNKSLYNTAHDELTLPTTP